MPPATSRRWRRDRAPRRRPRARAASARGAPGESRRGLHLGALRRETVARLRATRWREPGAPPRSSSSPTTSRPTARGVRALHAREGIELALFGGRSHHATAGVDDPGVPHRRVDRARASTRSPRPAATAPSCAARRGASRCRPPGSAPGGPACPFVLWSALWAQLHARAPRRPPADGRDLPRRRRGGGLRPARRGLRARHGARRVHVAAAGGRQRLLGGGARRRRAPAARSARCSSAATRPEKGRRCCVDAWGARGCTAPSGARAGRGRGGRPRRAVGAGAVAGSARSSRPSCATSTGPRTFWSYRRSPSRRFREPWGLVVNEAMNQHVAIVASDAVGAAAGGLVRDGATGSSSRPATPTRWRGRCGACTPTARCGRGWPPRGRATSGPTPSRPGPRASPRPWRRRGAPCVRPPGRLLASTAARARPSSPRPRHRPR